MSALQSPATKPHTAFKQLPLVDINLLFSSEISERKQAAKALGQAARDAGFLYIVGHGIPTTLIENLKNRTQRYFAQTLTEKMQDYIGHSNNHSGYVPEGEEQYLNAKPRFKRGIRCGI